MFPISRPSTSRSLSQTWLLQQCRAVSNSPYGRTHVWKRRAPILPNPVVPKFPQRVIRSDGTSFVHWTTSPRSVVRLTRDTTNNPVFNTGTWSNDMSIEEESATSGRLGRFSRRFEELGSGIDDAKWMEQMADTVADLTPKPELTKRKSTPPSAPKPEAKQPPKAAKKK